MHLHITGLKALTSSALLHVDAFILAQQTEQTAGWTAGILSCCLPHHVGINDDAGWRYGMSDWARSGPSINQNTPARADQIFSVLGALRRYKDTLEEELHAALMHAYLGPK